MFRPLTFIKYVISGIGVFVLSLFFSVGLVCAEDSSQSFTISPPIFELSANPGDQINEVISIFNSGVGDLSIAASIENLKPMGEKGQVQVVGDSDDSLPSLKDWISIKEGSFDLDKESTKNICEIGVICRSKGRFLSVVWD